MPLSTYLTNILPEAKRRKLLSPDTDIGFIPGSAEEHQEALKAGLASYPLGMKSQQPGTVQGEDWPSQASSLMQAQFGVNNPLEYGQKVFNEYTTAMNEKIRSMSPEQRQNIDWDKIRADSSSYRENAVKQADYFLKNYQTQWQQEKEMAKEGRSRRWQVETEGRAEARKRAEEERATVRVGMTESDEFAERFDKNLAPLMGLQADPMSPLRNQLDPESQQAYDSILRRGEELLRSKKMTPLNALNQAIEELGADIVEKQNVAPGWFGKKVTPYKGLVITGDRAAPGKEQLTPQAAPAPSGVSSKVDQYVSQFTTASEEDRGKVLGSIPDLETRNAVKKKIAALKISATEYKKPDKWGKESYAEGVLGQKKGDLNKTVGELKEEIAKAEEERRQLVSQGTPVQDPGIRNIIVKLGTLQDQLKQKQRTSRVMGRKKEIEETETLLREKEQAFQKQTKQYKRGQGFTAYLFDQQIEQLKNEVSKLKNKLRELREE